MEKYPQKSGKIALDERIFVNYNNSGVRKRNTRKGGNMSKEFNKLRGKFAERNMSQKQVAAQIGLNPSTMTRKMNGLSEFTRTEIVMISQLLDLTRDELNSVFFDL